MSILKFSQFILESEQISVYDKAWEVFLPKQITVIEGDASKPDSRHVFNKGNVMLNADMLQITYDNPEWGIPDTLEIDIYLVKDVQSGNIRLDVDITYGDFVACEFSIDKKNRLKVIQYTSYGSKFDPSNTVFAFNNASLREFINFLNRFNTGVKLTLDDFKFLNKWDDWSPN
jgi:hypothetical protein